MKNTLKLKSIIEQQQCVDEIYVIDALSWVQTEQNLTPKEFELFITRIIHLWTTLEDVSISDIIATIEKYKTSCTEINGRLWFEVLTYDLTFKDGENFIESILYC